MRKFVAKKSHIPDDRQKTSRRLSSNHDIAKSKDGEDNGRLVEKHDVFYFLKYYFVTGCGYNSVEQAFLRGEHTEIDRLGG